MKFFYYVHTGHRIGLDRFRRAATIIRSLGDIDITLLCSDFRIAHIAREFGVEKCVGIDVVRNIPQISQFGDKIIYDSEEANPIMLEDMRKYFSTFIRVSDSINDKKEQNELLISPYLEGEGICNGYVIDDTFFNTFEKSIKCTYFFGDDDYEKDLEKHISLLDGLEIGLQLGFYYFLDYEDALKKRFKTYYEFEDYEEVIQKTEILITASPQAVLESLACGSKPIYVQREDYTTDFIPLFESLNIPIVKGFNKEQLNDILQRIKTHKYHKIIQNSNKISIFIKENLEYKIN